MTNDEKNRIIAKAIGSQKGLIVLADAMVRPINGGGVTSSLQKCMICGRNYIEDGCNGVGKFPLCWRPEGTMVATDEVEL